MILWIILALITLVVSAALLFPLLRSRTGSSESADYDIQVYQSQLAELEQAAAAQQLSEASVAAARTEISRRILAADRRRSGAQAEPVASKARPRRLLLAGGVALAVPIGAVLLYLQLGSPGLPNQPFAERVAAAGIPGGQRGGPAAENEMAGLVDQLAQRLAREPENLDGWILLGRSLLQLGRLQDAAEAFGTAAKLAPDDAQLQAGYGEALTMAANGMVIPAARAAFASSLKSDPGNPRARYYQGLARSQEGDLRGALDSWLALAGDTPADAPWRETLGARIRQARAQLGLDPEAELPVASGSAATPGATPGTSPRATPGPSAEDVAAAQAMPAEERQAMVESMVARLAERLEENPEDLSGWLMLARSYNQLGRPEAERDALAKAAALEPANPEILAMYGRAIRVAAGNRQTEESAAVMRRLIEVDKTNMQALWFVALAEVRAGRKDEARALFDRALAQVPPDSPERADLEARIEVLLSGAP